MQEKLNLRFLAWSLIGLALVGLAWFGTHWLQVRRHARSLLAYADQAEAREQLDRAARFMGLYLGLDPRDTETRARYGLLLDRLATSQRAKFGAVAVLEDVLVQEPARHDLRKRLISLEMALNRFDDAIEHVNMLRAASKDDEQLEDMFGRCLEARGQFKEAAEAYRRAIRCAPGQVETHARLCLLLRDRLNQGREAEKILDQMVQENSQVAQAFLTRARYHLEAHATTGVLQSARADAEKALKLAPDDAGALLVAAEASRRLPNGAEAAAKLLERFLNLYPADIRGYESLAAVEAGAGHQEQAIACLRRGLKAAPDHPNLTWNLAHLLIQTGSIKEAEPLVAALSNREDMASARVEFLVAATHVHNKEWAAARAGLEKIRPQISDSKELTLQCDLWLAQCHKALGEVDRQMLVYRRILNLDPFETSARFQIILSLLSEGRLNEAFDECQQLLALPRPPGAAWSLMARIMILQNLRLPAERRQWTRIETLLEKAEQAAPEATEVPILRAQMLAGQNRLDEARNKLEKARLAHPDRKELWIALVDLAAQAGKFESGLALLQEAEGKLGGNAEFRLANLRLALRLPPRDCLQKLPALEERLDQFDLDSQIRLLNALVRAYQQLGKPDQARRLLTQIDKLRPKEFEVQAQLFELALASSDEAAMTKALNALREREGPERLVYRYENARCLIWKARRHRGADLDQARAELVALSKEQPGWSRVPLCLAEIEELEGRKEAAIKKYLRAIELGDQQLEVIGRVLQLMFECRQYGEAENVIRRLVPEVPPFGNLPQLAAEVSLQVHHYDRALELARKAVQADSKNYHDYVWLGQVLWIISQKGDIDPAKRRAAAEQAEPCLRRAVELAEHEPEAWVALIQHLARTGQTAKAESAIQQARAKIAKDKAKLALAECYASINNVDKAKELYEAALQDHPQDAVLLRASADFYLRLDRLREAEDCLRRTMALRDKEPEAAASAQLVLAVLLAARGNAPQAREALNLVSVPTRQTGQSNADDIETLRARAVVLALQPGRRPHQQAIAILEGIPSLTPEDQFLLVQLYDGTGDTLKSRDRLLSLLAAKRDPRHLAYHVRNLLRQGQTREAGIWLANLEELQPRSPVTIELHARLLAAQGKGAQAAGLLVPLAQGKDPRSILTVAALLEELKQNSEAERMYRAYSEVQKPDGVLALARFLGRRERVPEALDLCERSSQACGCAGAADAAIAVLRDGHPAEAQLTRFELWLQAALQSQPDNKELLICRASLSDLRGHYAEAEGLYRKVLASDQQNAVALNNLAGLLVHADGKGDEALPLVERAIEILGAIPELLDTRAMAYLAMGQHEGAIADLENALARPALDPKLRAILNFHLAEAFHKAGRKQEAAKELRQADSLGVNGAGLHPLEQGNYQKLTVELAKG